MADGKSVKRRLGEKLLMPIVAAGTSAAAGYLMKEGPGFVEDKVWPRVREAAQGAGGVADKLPEQARSVVASGTELAEQLTDRARDVTGGPAGGEGGSSPRISQDELSRRSEERARHRAKRRKATKSK